MNVWRGRIAVSLYPEAQSPPRHPWRGIPPGPWLRAAGEHSDECLLLRTGEVNYCDQKYPEGKNVTPDITN